MQKGASRVAQLRRARISLLQRTMLSTLLLHRQIAYLADQLHQRCTARLMSLLPCSASAVLGLMAASIIHARKKERAKQPFGRTTRYRREYWTEAPKLSGHVAQLQRYNFNWRELLINFRESTASETNNGQLLVVGPAPKLKSRRRVADVQTHQRSYINNNVARGRSIVVNVAQLVVRLAWSCSALSCSLVALISLIRARSATPTKKQQYVYVAMGVPGYYIERETREKKHAYVGEARQVQLEHAIQRV